MRVGEIRRFRKDGYKNGNFLIYLQKNSSFNQIKKKKMDLDYSKFRISSKGNVRLSDYQSDYTDGMTKEEGKREKKQNKKELKKLQELFWADNRYSMLIVLQAPDAAGKDGAIRHVMSGLNPQGCRVHSYKRPSKKELDHDYLWRHYKDLPERGMIEVFNRSYYENVLVTKVNPEFLMNENLPAINKPSKADDEFWKRRYRQINNFERHLVENGTIVVKFFLNLSKEEQKRRLLDRINKPEKNWKFSSADLEARAQWDEYQKVYEEMLQETSTDYAPWYVIPADYKYFSRAAIGKIIIDRFKELDLHYPASEDGEILQKAKQILLGE